MLMSIFKYKGRSNAFKVYVSSTVKMNTVNFTHAFGLIASDAFSVCFWHVRYAKSLANIVTIVKSSYWAIPKFNSTSEIVNSAKPDGRSIGNFRSEFASIRRAFRFRNRSYFFYSARIYCVTSINDHIDREPVTEPICETSHFRDDRSFRICQSVDSTRILFRYSIAFRDYLWFFYRNVVHPMTSSIVRRSLLLKVSASPIVHS